MRACPSRNGKSTGEGKRPVKCPRLWCTVSVQGSAEECIAMACASAQPIALILYTLVRELIKPNVKTARLAPSMPLLS